MEDRLKKFVQIVDIGSFTKASRTLHISQPALSAAISKLERELQTPLLIRDTRSLRLTPAGSIAYEAGKELLIHTQNLKTRISELQRQRHAMTIGMVDSVANALFTNGAVIDSLEKQAKITIVINNSRILRQAVERATLDMAFIIERGSIAVRTLQMDYIGTEPLVVVCHQGILEETIKDLAAGRITRFLSYDQPSNTHRLIYTHLLARGITTNPIFYSTSPEIMLRLVLLQKGVAALPYTLARPHIETGALVILHEQAPLLIPRRIASIRRQDQLLTRAHHAILAQVTQRLHELNAEAEASST